MNHTASRTKNPTSEPTLLAGDGGYTETMKREDQFLAALIFLPLIALALGVYLNAYFAGEDKTAPSNQAPQPTQPVPAPGDTFVDPR